MSSDETFANVEGFNANQENETTRNEAPLTRLNQQTRPHGSENSSTLPFLGLDFIADVVQYFELDNELLAKLYSGKLYHDIQEHMKRQRNFNEFKKILKHEYIWQIKKKSMRKILIISDKVFHLCTQTKHSFVFLIPIKMKKRFDAIESKEQEQAQNSACEYEKYSKQWEELYENTKQIFDIENCEKILLENINHNAEKNVNKPGYVILLDEIKGKNKYYCYPQVKIDNDFYSNSNKEPIILSNIFQLTDRLPNHMAAISVTFLHGFRRIHMSFGGVRFRIHNAKFFTDLLQYLGKSPSQISLQDPPDLFALDSSFVEEIKKTQDEEYVK